MGGSDLTLRRVELDEGREVARYNWQLKELRDEPSIAILREVIANVGEHHRCSSVSFVIAGRSRHLLQKKRSWRWTNW
jgi:hypothetical protein